MELSYVTVTPKADNVPESRQDVAPGPPVLHGFPPGQANEVGNAKNRKHTNKYTFFII